MIRSVRFVDMSTARTLLARVLWVDDSDGNASECRLVRDELTQLPECPVAQARSLTPHSRNPRADVLKVFEPNAAPGAFSSRNERLRNTVVGVCLELPLLPSKFAEAPLCGLRAATLQPSFAPRCVSPTGLDFGAAVDRPVTVCGDVDDTHVNAQPVGRNAGWFGFDFARQYQEPFPLAVSQGCFALGEREKALLPLSHRDGEFHPASNSPDRHHVAKYAEHVLGVEVSAQRSEVRHYRSRPAEYASHLGHALGQRNRPDVEFLPRRAVAEIVQVELAEHASGETSSCNPVRNLIAASKRFAQRFGLLSGRNDLDCNGQFHGLSCAIKLGFWQEISYA